ncbi:alpha/beta fold hydrolase [Burkholderia stabilis]|uniref:alpha/beta fold hydrolase n=1 Tax=Burkholderia stabilis TaxID=95485 RepID=UPI001E3500A2|nr:alpha/beta hydrolase [Burkholderia stabilis]
MQLHPVLSEFQINIGKHSIRCYDSDPSREKSNTIVLMHGTGGSAALNFWALFPMLAMRHRVVAFDFVDIEDDANGGYVEQASAVMETISCNRPVHVVGYSFGAVIAAQVAAIRPSWVASLTLVAGWMKTDRHQLLRNDVWRDLHEARHPSLPAFSFLSQFSQQFINSKTPAEIDAMIGSIRNGPDRSAKMRFNRTVDITEQVEKISSPTLVVGCTFDQMVPVRHSRLLFGAIENSRFAQIDAGHGVVVERPSELFTMIDTFVKDPEAELPGTILLNNHA